MSKLEALSARFNKAKKKTVSGFASEAFWQPEGVIPFGLYAVDRYIRGGVPVGKITQIYGEEQSCKSTLTLTLIANAQRLGKRCGFIDAELTFDPIYAATLGVDLTKLWLHTPEDGTETVEVAVEALGSGELDLLVVDSVGAIVPRAMLDSEVGKSMPAARARLVSDFVRRAMPITYFNSASLVLINHLGGSMKQDFHGNEIVAPEGGKKLQYFSTLKLRTRRVAKPLMDGDRAVASEIVVKLDKNKTDAAFREGNLVYQFGQGFDHIYDLIETAIDEGLIAQAGAFYTVGGQKIQGKAKLVAALNEDLTLRAELKEALEVTLAAQYTREIQAEGQA